MVPLHKYVYKINYYGYNVIKSAGMKNQGNIRNLEDYLLIYYMRARIKSSILHTVKLQ